MNEWETAIDLLMHEGFQGGLIAGLALLGLFFVVSQVTKSGVTAWAIGFSVVVILILSLRYSVDPLVVGSLGAVALAGLSVDLAHSIQPGPVGYALRVIAWILTAAAVVWFTSVANTAEEPWISVAFPLMVLFMGAAVWSYRYSIHADLLGPIVAVATLGVWVTVPETDMFTIVVGACIPLGLATLSTVRARAGALGSFVLAGVIAWLTIAGGETRPLSVIGGWSAFGVLPLIPLLSSLGFHLDRRIVVFVVHVAYAVLATRVVDIWDAIPVALSIIVGLVVLSGVALVMLGKAEAEESPIERAEAQMT